MSNSTTNSTDNSTTNSIITQENVTCNSHERLCEVYKFLHSSWRGAIIECMKFDYKKFSHQAYDVLEFGNELSSLMSYGHAPSSMLLSMVLQFNDTYPYDVINRVITSPESDIEFYNFDFIYANIKDVITTEYKIKSHIGKDQNTHQEVIAILDEFTNKKCDNGNITSSLCDTTYFVSRMLKDTFESIDFDDIFIDFLHFAKDLGEIVNECIRYKFDCKCTSYYVGNEKIDDFVCCSNGTAYDAESVVQWRNTTNDNVVQEQDVINAYDQNTTNQSDVSPSGVNNVTHHEL